MSSDESSNDSSSSSDNSILIPMSERFNDFTQWHEQNMEQDRLLQNALISHLIQSSTSSNPTPRARRRYIERNREEGHARVFSDYFADDPVYPAHMFHRRFRMQKHVFLRLVDSLTERVPFFQEGNDATGRGSHTTLQRCTAAIRFLAYGASGDSIDEYLRMSNASIRESLVEFVDGVINIFGNEYLRRPNQQYMTRLLYVGEQRGFPGMMGSIDCMHWEWKNCPTAWAGQYAGRNKKATIILEAVASYDLWIWHAFFGSPGSSNDINVLQRSPVFDDILEGRAPQVNFTVNGNEYNMGYYLTDGIYPQWATFVKSINAPQLQKHKLFAQCQEAVRKDVERAFGVLQARFAYIKRPCLVWDPILMRRILMACIIMHNMIVEDERDTYANYFDTTEFEEDLQTATNRTTTATVGPSQYSTRPSSLTTYMQRRVQLRDRETHNGLKNDLVEHMWQKFGNRN